MALNGESSKQGHTYGPTTVHDSHIHQGDNIYLSNETPKIDCRDALLLKDPFAYRESLKSDKGERASGTCEWIRENEIYRSWVDGDEHCLWICGGPGKGKTMLSIFLTEELERKQPKGEHDHDTTLLYFFCTNGNESYNNATVVLRGLAYQLLSKHPDISTSVSQYFETPKHTANTLASPEILWMVFKTLLRASKLDTVYCILDGLDECDGKSIGILVKQFRDFYSPSDHTGPIAQNLKLAIVSRKINGLEDFPQIRLDPDNNNCINEDIKRFISTAMQELSRRQHHDDDFLRDVENTLLRRSDGTFLWIGFVMKELLEMSTRMEVEEVLHALPQGLPAMYGRMLRQIKSSQRHIISTILRCVTVARRPMTLEELKTAVALLCNAPIDSTPIMRDRIASCGPILQTSEGQDTCSLVHQSARDYLLREEVDNDPILEGFRIKEKEVHTSLARICLAYIKNSDFRHGYLDITDASVLQKSPLLGYATQHWLEHARYAEEEVDISKTFFQKDHGVWKRWYEAYKVDHKLILNPATGDSTLHIASYLGIVPLVRKLLQANAWRISPKFQKYVNWRNRVGRTPLILAAGQGHHDVVQLLLANGADVYLRSDGRSLFSGALVDAATWGHTSVIQLLLANGTDPKLRCYKLALNYAADSGHTAIVQLLLAKHEGINVDSFRTHRLRGVDSAFQTALSLAAGNGHEAIVRLLLANGADVNIKDEHGNTALQKAARGGHEAIVQLLLTKGVDVNLENGIGRAALHYAAENGHETTVHLLLTKGADVNIPVHDSNRITPISLAAYEGHEAIVQLLLANGADFPIEERAGMVALHGAASNGHEAMVQLLLANGADANITNKNGITALHHAAERRHKIIVQLLLANGADVNIKDQHGNTALYKATKWGSEAIVRLLLADGADVNIKDQHGNTALYKATENGHEAMVRLLLENGADANITNKDGITALHHAVDRRHEATVRLLLVNGADVNIQDQHGNTALYKATKWGSEAIVRLLLENGADSKDDAFDKALAEAAWRGHEAIVRLMLADSAHADIKGSAALIRAAGRGNKHILRMLLENGADVNEEHLEYGIRYTALEMAAKRGHISTVQFLLTNGAWNVSTKDTEEPSKTALDWAVQEGHGGIVQLLLANGVSRADLIKALRLAVRRRHGGVFIRILKSAGQS